MPTYHYQALNAAGQQISADIDATAPEDAHSKIRAHGHFPTRIKQLLPKSKPTPHKKRTLNISFGKVSIKSLTAFTRQLSVLQDAGLPILRSLKILAQQEKPGRLKTALESVGQQVEAGDSLSQAMSRRPEAFNRLYVNMVQAGESGGVLDVILQRLAEFMEKAQRLKRRVIGALIYPAVVITFSVLIVTGIMIVVVPKFQEIFRDFRTTLPAITTWLIALSRWIANDFGWALILGSPFAAFLFIKLLRKSSAGKHLSDKLILKTPILGQILRKTAIARLARTLGTLLAAGVAILDALNITRDTVGNTVYENALQKVHDAIREGESFAAPFRNTRVCDNLVTNMINVGEETGDLDKMLLKIADNYDEQVDVLVGSLVSLLEPVMVIALGGIVGTIVVALFMPLAKLLGDMSSGGRT